MRRTLVTLACLGAVATVTACGSESGQPTGSDSKADTQQQTTAAPEPAAKTADPPQAFDTSKPVGIPVEAAKANHAGNLTNSFMTLRDRTAYIVTPKGMAAVDILTGKQTWTVPFDGTPGDPYNQAGPFANPTGPQPPAVTDKLVAAAVPIKMPEQGTTPAYYALSVIAADLTGRKAWQVNVRATEDPYANASDAVTKVVTITDKAVVATYTRQSDVVTAGLDLATGKTLWTQKNFNAQALYGDNLLVGNQIEKEHYGSGKVVARDAGTGEQKWTVQIDPSAATVFPGDPALVALGYTDYSSGAPYLAFLDPATGTVKNQTKGADRLDTSTCHYDEQSVLLCESSSGLTGYDAKTGTKLWALPDQASGRVEPQFYIAWHGVLYGKTKGGQPITLDARTGKDISTGVGIAPDWVSKYGGIAIDKDGHPQAYPVK